MNHSGHAGISTHKISVSTGATIAYTDTGAKPGFPTLIFLHGLGTYSGSWLHNIEALKKSARCIAIDLPGHGFSSRGDYPYTMRFFAHSLIDFIGRLALRDVCLAGHSMGGQIALTTVLEEPQCASRLVLCAPAGFETFSGMEKATQNASARALDFFSDEESTLRQTVFASFYRFPANAQGLISDLVRITRQHPPAHFRQTRDRCIGSMMESYVYANLPRVRTPALVIFGEEDALIPAKMFSQRRTRQVAEEGSKRLPGAVLYMVPKAGHFVHWEKAAVVNKLIEQWLRAPVKPA